MQGTLVNGALFQIPAPPSPKIEITLGKPDGAYSFTAVYEGKKLNERGAGHVDRVLYSTSNGHLQIDGCFMAHFEGARVQLVLNGKEQGQMGSVLPIQAERASGLELASDAAFNRWTWCDAVDIDPSAVLQIEARLVRGSRTLASAELRIGAGGLSQVGESLSPSYHVSPHRPAFDTLLETIDRFDGGMPTIAFLFPGDMGRTFGGGPSRVISMAAYFRRMGFQSVLIDRVQEGAADNSCDVPVSHGFDFRLGLGQAELPELAMIALDEAWRSETSPEMRTNLAQAIELASSKPDVLDDVILRREDHNVNAVASFLIGRFRPDVVVCNFAWTSGVLRMLPSSICKILDTHDIQFIRGEMHAARFDDHSLKTDKNVEIAAWHTAEYVVAIHADEKDTIIAESSRNNVVLASHAVDHLGEMRAEEPGPVVLFVGNRYGPNTNGVRHFITDAWPIVRARVPDAVLEVVGSVGRDFTDQPEGVSILGVVPDIDEAYARAAVVINPIDTGTGVSIKMVEALSACRAVVSTGTGSRGIAAETAAMIVPFEEMGDAVADLLLDPVKRRNLEQAAHDFASTELSPDRAYRELFNTIELRLYQ